MTRVGLFFGLMLLIHLQSIAQEVGLGFGVVTEYAFEENTFPDDTRIRTYVETEEFERFLRPSIGYYSFIRSRELFHLETGRFGGYYSNYLVVDSSNNQYKPLSGQEIMDFKISFRAGYGIIVKEKDRVSTYLSLCVQPKYQRRVHEPKITGFKTAETELGVDFEIQTNTFIQLNDHVRLNIALPIKIWNYSLIWNRIDNPAIPIHQQRTSDIDKRFFPLGIELKMGLVYMFSKD